jgi:glycosyltransferase involved in cell wall biosynthesis
VIDFSSPLKLALVAQRYGEEILGGAETFARHLAEQLRRRGARVDVLTTCAVDHLTWKNALPAGETRVHGVRVIRFPINPAWETARYHDLHARIMFGMGLTRDEEFEWAATGAHSAALYSFIQQHEADYDFFVFIPYLFPVTLLGAHLCPQKTIIWPCLHDESYARLYPVRLLLAGARGLMLNTPAERDLAWRLGLRHPNIRLVGFGVEGAPGDPTRARQAHNLSAPYVLYSGRIEASKNVPLLINSFLHYKATYGGDLKLVLMGAGPEPVPPHPDIMAVGFQRDQAKLDLYAGALALCQPSVNESFSIVIMEAWLMKVPVMVHAQCAVTRSHARLSQGGLYFWEADDFAASLHQLVQTPALGQRLGANGWRYVTTNYNWEAVLRRFFAALAHWRVHPQSMLEQWDPAE